MSDLISRNELTEAIKRQYCTGCDNYNGSRCRACHADDMLSLVDDAADAMTRWISVKEMLPFYNTTVLCIDVDNKHVFIGNMLTCHLHQNKGAMCCAVQGLHGVRYATYWMPLPEPPKEET